MMSWGVGVGFGIPIRPLNAPALHPDASIDAAKSVRSAIFICEPFRGYLPAYEYGSVETPPNLSGKPRNA